MNADDESLVNKVFEAVGLTLLSEHNTITVRQTSGNGSLSQQLPGDSGFISSLPAVTTLVEDPSLQLATSSNSNTGVGQNGFGASLDAMSYDDFGQWSWEDNVSPDWPWMTLFADEYDVPQNVEPNLTVSQGFSRPQGNAVPSTLAIAPGQVESSFEDEVDQDLIAQISARFGSLHMAADGQLRYFGTPTNAHLFNSSKNSGPYASQRSMRVDGARLLRNADLDRVIDQSVEQHLIELYFTWHNSCHPVIDKSMYWTAREQANEGAANKGFFSDVLTNAMQVFLFNETSESLFAYRVLGAPSAPATKVVIIPVL